VLRSVIHVGDPAPLGGGFEPAVVAHLHGNGVTRFVAYEVHADGTLERVPGAYAPDPGEEPPHPITDLLVARYPRGASRRGGYLRVAVHGPANLSPGRGGNRRSAASYFHFHSGLGTPLYP